MKWVLITLSMYAICLHGMDTFKQVTTIHDVAPYAGHIVAYTHQLPASTVPPSLIHAAHAAVCFEHMPCIYFGYIREKTQEWKGFGAGYAMQKMITARGIATQSILTNKSLQSEQLCVRLATTQEKKDIDNALQEKLVTFDFWLQHQTIIKHIIRK